jgi:hypothetical protein
MTSAFQCSGFQNDSFQSECIKKHGEATYHPVVFQDVRRREEDTILALFAVARSESKRRRFKIQ